MWLIAIIALLMSAADTQALVPPPKVLKQKDSGRTVRLLPGQELQVRLKVCYSCGYHWATQLAPDNGVLKRLKQRDSGGCQVPCVGGSAVTIFRYRAKADGTTKLRLGYIPPGQQPADKIFNLRVLVRT